MITGRVEGMDGGNESNAEMSGLFKSEWDQRTQWTENTRS